MAIYVMPIKRAHDPLSGTAMDMWAVMDEGDGNRQLAYCSRAEDAERIKLRLERERVAARIDAVHQFAAFLVGRKERSGPFSSRDDAAPMANLIVEFLKWKGWE